MIFCVHKSADKGSSIVVWYRLDYVAEAQNQFSDSNTYQAVKFSGKDQVKLDENSNSVFKSLTVIKEKEKNNIKFNFKKATNVGKSYLLPKIYTNLRNMPGRFVTLNCGNPTEKVLEFLDHHLQPVVKEGNRTWKIQGKVQTKGHKNSSKM